MVDLVALLLTVAAIGWIGLAMYRRGMERGTADCAVALWGAGEPLSWAHIQTVRLEQEGREAEQAFAEACQAPIRELAEAE